MIRLAADNLRPSAASPIFDSAGVVNSEKPLGVRWSIECVELDTVPFVPRTTALSLQPGMLNMSRSEWEA